MPTRFHKWLLIAPVLAAAAALAGCGAKGGKPTAHLSGAVLIDDQPAPADAYGTIGFRTTSAAQARDTSAQITNGQYDCPDVPVGKVMVFIQVVRRTGKMVDSGGRQVPEIKDLIASKYNSGFEIDVSGGDAKRDFELTSN